VEFDSGCALTYELMDVPGIPSAVGYAVERGERLAKKGKYDLLD